MGRERKVRKQLEPKQIIAGKEILRCSSTTSDTVLITALGMYCTHPRQIESKERAKEEVTSHSRWSSMGQIIERAG